MRALKLRRKTSTLISIQQLSNFKILNLQNYILNLSSSSQICLAVLWPSENILGASAYKVQYKICLALASNSKFFMSSSLYSYSSYSSSLFLYISFVGMFGPFLITSQSLKLTDCMNVLIRSFHSVKFLPSKRGGHKIELCSVMILLVKFEAVEVEPARLFFNPSKEIMSIYKHL